MACLATRKVSAKKYKVSVDKDPFTSSASFSEEPCKDQGPE